MTQKIIKTKYTHVVGLQNVIDTINGTVSSNYTTLDAAIQQEAGDRATAVSGVQTTHSAFVAGDFTTLQTLVSTINADSSTAGSFRKVVADSIAAIVNGADANFDTLIEIQTWLTNNPAAADLVTQLTAMTTAYEAADAQEVIDRTAADAALEVSLKAYTDDAIAALNATSHIRIENVSVTGDNIVLSDMPKFGVTSGVAAIQNWARVFYYDPVDDATYEAPVVADVADPTGKTYTIQVGTSGEWNGKVVTIQYTY